MLRKFIDVKDSDEIDVKINPALVESLTDVPEEGQTWIQFSSGKTLLVNEKCDDLAKRLVKAAVV